MSRAAFMAVLGIGLMGIGFVGASLLPVARAETPSLATMKTALEKGDLDEATRQGVLAGAVTVQTALGSSDRSIVLAGIASAPRIEGRAELLDALAAIARGPDRRTAIPATRAAVQIARELARVEPADDIANADIAAWRDRFGDIALDRTRWVEVRVLAIDAAVYLERARALAPSDPSAAAGSNPGAGSTSAGSTSAGSTSAGSTSAGSTSAGSTSAGSGRRIDLSRADGTGVPLAPMFADPDPAIRRAILAHAPSPLPPELREPIAKLVHLDTDALVALAATAALCADLAFDPAQPILAVLGPAGITRVQAIVATEGASRGHVREAARCLAAEKSPASLAALRKIRHR